jgi:hypothetical protein
LFPLDGSKFLASAGCFVFDFASASSVLSPFSSRVTTDRGFGHRGKFDFYSVVHQFEGWSNPWPFRWLGFSFHNLCRSGIPILPPFSGLSMKSLLGLGSCCHLGDFARSRLPARVFQSPSQLGARAGRSHQRCCPERAPLFCRACFSRQLISGLALLTQPASPAILHCYT